MEHAEGPAETEVLGQEAVLHGGERALTALHEPGTGMVMLSMNNDKALHALNPEVRINVLTAVAVHLQDIGTLSAHLVLVGLNEIQSTWRQGKGPCDNVTQGAPLLLEHLQQWPSLAQCTTTNCERSQTSSFSLLECKHSQAWSRDTKPGYIQ